MSYLNRMLATSISLIMVGSLIACNFEQTREVGMTPEQGESATTEGERRSAVREDGAASLEDLQTGEELDYYLREFSRLGYEIQDVAQAGNQTTYELRERKKTEGSEAAKAEDALKRYEVTLTQPNDENRIRNIDVRELNVLAADQQMRDERVQEVRTKVQNLEPGKTPTQYLPELNQLGTVQSYKLHKNNRATVELEADNKRFTIQMNVEPNTEKVTSFELEKDIIAL